MRLKAFQHTIRYNGHPRKRARFVSVIHLALAILAIVTMVGARGAFEHLIGPRLGLSSTAAAAPLPLQDFGAQENVPAEVLAIFDVASGQVEFSNGGSRVERFLSADDSQEEFVLVCATEQDVCARTITYDGQVSTSAIVPGMATWWTVHDLETFAVSPDQDAVAYIDRVDKCFYTLELQTGNREPVLENVQYILSAAYWTAPNEIVLAVWKDSAKSDPAMNSIVEINLQTKESRIVYRGSDFDPRKTEFVLSPDRKHLLFIEIDEKLFWPGIQVLDLQSREVRPVVPAEEDVELSNLCWSPDGKRIAYVRYGRSERSDPSAADAQRFAELASKETLSPSDAEELQALMDTMDTRYEADFSICVCSISGEDTIKYADFQDDTYIYGLAFLNEGRLILEAEDDDELPALMTVDIASGKSSLLKRGRFLGDIIPVAGETKAICLLEQD